MDPIDHPVSRYATDVIEGKIIAGDLVRKACERHLLDLETGADRGLWFDCAAADRIMQFAKVIRHTKGPLAGKPMELQPWQVFRHGSVFGWKRDNGLRRFRSCYNQVGKKNGKTTDTAVPMLFTQLLDGESSPEGYCAATTRDQANILFNDLKTMVKRSPLLSAGMIPWRSYIETPDVAGVIKSLSRDGNSSDGINPSFVARDEMHRWTDRELADTIVESMIARAQPIDWVITTAGHDINGLCGELRQYAEKVLTDKIEDDRFFAYVAEPPADADPDDSMAWAMGNPNMNVSKPEAEIAAACEKAQAISASMPNFRRFHLNLWTAGAEDWIAQDVWGHGAAGAPIPIERLKGRKAWAALDLSETTDMTAIAVAVPVDGLIYVIVYSFLPSGPKGFQFRAQTENRDYIAWRDQGWLEVHHGGTIDQNEIVKRLQALRSTFDLQEVNYDPWRMKYLAAELDDMAFPMVEFRQGFGSFSNPMKLVEERVAQNRLRHGNNPVLADAVSNVHRDQDPAGNIKPNKKRSRGRIDPAVAMIMAVGRAEANESAKKERSRAVGVI